MASSHMLYCFGGVVGSSDYIYDWWKRNSLVCVCVCVWVCVCLCATKYVFAFTCRSTCACALEYIVCASTCMSLHACAWAYRHWCICACLHVHIMCVCVCVLMCMGACTLMTACVAVVCDWHCIGSTVCFVYVQLAAQSIRWVQSVKSVLVARTDLARAMDNV